MGTNEIIRKAGQGLKKGRYSEALERLRPLLQEDVPEALFLFDL